MGLVFTFFGGKSRCCPEFKLENPRDSAPILLGRAWMATSGQRLLFEVLAQSVPSLDAYCVRPRED